MKKWVQYGYFLYSSRLRSQMGPSADPWRCISRPNTQVPPRHHVTRVSWCWEAKFSIAETSILDGSSRSFLPVCELFLQDCQDGMLWSSRGVEVRMRLRMGSHGCDQDLWRNDYRVWSPRWRARKRTREWERREDSNARHKEMDSLCSIAETFGRAKNV